MKSTPTIWVLRPGFTLLEILVVLLIIGLIASVVVINISGSGYKTELRSAAHTISNQIELARNESTFRNELWGISIKRDKVRFLKFDPGTDKWNSVTRLSYRRVELDENYEIRLDTQERDLQPEPVELEETVPDLVIEPTGEVTPFEISIEYVPERLAWYIYSDGLAQSEVTTESHFDEYKRMSAQ